MKIAFLLFLTFGSATVFSQKLPDPINNGLDFLYKNQFASGEFKSFECLEPDMSNCSYEPSPFLTPFVLMSIQEISDPRKDSIVKRGIQYILNEQQGEGIWSFWAKSRGEYIQPDLDDMAVNAHCLRLFDTEFKHHPEHFAENRNALGQYYTWFPNFMGMNDVDCAVNANILAYLGKNDSVICTWIIDEINARNSCSIYYPDEWVLYFLLSRAVSCSISCFAPLTDTISQRYTAWLKTSPEIDDMHIALALLTAHNLNIKAEWKDKFVNELLVRQQKDGSWNSGWLYVFPEKNKLLQYRFRGTYYGSKEFTTAFALEALWKTKYRTK